MSAIKPAIRSAIRSAISGAIKVFREFLTFNNDTAIQIDNTWFPDDDTWTVRLKTSFDQASVGSGQDANIQLYRVAPTETFHLFLL